jgi:hypothetical protein
MNRLSQFFVVVLKLVPTDPRVTLAVSCLLLVTFEKPECSFTFVYT